MDPIKIPVIVDDNLEDFDKQLSEFVKSIDGLSDEQLVIAFKLSDSSYEQVNKFAKLVNDTIKSLENSPDFRLDLHEDLYKARDALELFKSTASKTNTDIGKMGDGVKKVTDGIGKASEGLTKTGDSANSVSDNLGDAANKARKLKEEAGKAGENLEASMRKALLQVEAIKQAFNLVVDLARKAGEILIDGLELYAERQSKIKYYEGLTGSLEEATARYRELNQMAIENPFLNVDELYSLTQAVRAYGLELKGLGSEYDIVNIAGDAAINMGKGKDAIETIIRALGRMNTAQRLQQRNE